MTKQSRHQGAGTELPEVIGRWARIWVWALPVWGILLALSTLTHQPDYTTDFESYADYVTTAPFLISHIVASIGGAVLAVIGAVALAIPLATTPPARTALRGLTTFIAGQLLMLSGFAVAAFFQPAIGRAFQEGHDAVSRSINADVYGPELIAMIGVGLILFIVGAALLGRAANHSGLAPVWAGRMFALAVPAFAVAGFTVEILQPVAGLMIAVSCGALARGVSSDSIGLARDRS